MVLEYVTSATRRARYVRHALRDPLPQPLPQPFFFLQFEFLYEGWRNEAALDLKTGLPIFAVGALLLVVAAGAVGDAAVLLGPFAAESLVGAESLAAFSEALSNALPSFDGLF